MATEKIDPTEQAERKAAKAAAVPFAATPVVSGSFDPFTLGHYDVVCRAKALFGRAVVLIGKNPGKESFFPETVRIEAIKACFPEGDVAVESFDGLLAEFAKRYENPVFVRGARNGNDFVYEAELCAENRELGGIDTVILPCDGRLAHISSSYARERIRYGRDLRSVVPPAAEAVLEAYLRTQKG